MNADDEAVLRAAITQRRLVRFTLHGRIRIAEPHDYGIRDGKAQLLAYQVAGESKSGKLPNWRWVVLSQATGFALLDRTFPGGRLVPGQHAQWDRLILRVEH